MQKQRVICYIFYIHGMSLPAWLVAISKRSTQAHKAVVVLWIALQQSTCQGKAAELHPCMPELGFDLRERLTPRQQHHCQELRVWPMWEWGSTHIKTLNWLSRGSQNSAFPHSLDQHVMTDILKGSQLPWHLHGNTHTSITVTLFVYSGTCGYNPRRPTEYNS